MHIIRKNDSGPAVEDVQQRLRMLGFELSVDGQFQARTQEAVRKFRAEEELPAGDVIDQQTWSARRRDLLSGRPHALPAHALLPRL